MLLQDWSVATLQPPQFKPMGAQTAARRCNTSYPEGTMTISRRIFAGSIVTLLLAGCMASATPREPQPDTTLRVDNQAVLDMDIYALQNSQRIRIGTAGALKVSVFKIPPSLIFGISTFRFIADPIGSRRLPVTEEISVTPGDEITMTIPPSY
jgi:hypothetical protein